MGISKQIKDIKDTNKKEFTPVKVDKDRKLLISKVKI